MPALTQLPVLALAEQFDVVSGDLLAVIGADDTLAGSVLAELLLHRWQLDGSAPGPAATAVVLAVTGAGDLEAWQRLCAEWPASAKA